MRVELVPLPHRPPLATNCTLQVPSNLAGSAKAEPDRITPVVKANAARVFVSMNERSPTIVRGYGRAIRLSFVAISHPTLDMGNACSSNKVINQQLCYKARHIQ